MEFLFEKLEVYKLALDFVDSVDELIESIRGRFPASRIDQLTRASMSIPLNIAEGNGRRRFAERGHFFSIARASGFECAAVLQILRRKRLLSDGEYELRARQLMSLTKMLSGLINHSDKRIGETKATRSTQPILDGRIENALGAPRR